MYEDFFPKMAKAGENLAEVWMASWWVGIEWTRKWRDFHGPGRYSLPHAWLLDQIFAMAARHGIHIHLVIDNHGKFDDWCDPEWQTNPFNRRGIEESGYVDYPHEYFTDEACRRYHKQRLRYIAARWGAHLNLLGWELVSEFDLAGGQQFRRSFFRMPQAREWVREMFAALRSFDPYAHPITNHYASDWKWVDRTLAETVLDYIVGDAYTAERGFANMAIQTDRALATFGKPFMITEFGGNWDATTPPRLEADLHCGLWSSWMTSAAGTPLFWWYDLIDRKGLYGTFGAFSKFIAGEDRRGIRGTTVHLSVSGSTSPGLSGEEAALAALQGLGYLWPDGAYLWVYDAAAMRDMPLPQNRLEYRGACLDLNGLIPGRYRIEFWNTAQEGKVKEEEQTVSPGIPLRVSFPAFKNDMAAKVKALSNHVGPAVPSGSFPGPNSKAPDLPANSPGPGR
jgi:hypothetical protein